MFILQWLIIGIVIAWIINPASTREKNKWAHEFDAHHVKSNGFADKFMAMGKDTVTKV